MANIIRSQSSTPCDFCTKIIPADTEIANEKSTSWHPACHKAAVAARKLVPIAVRALRGIGCESEAAMMDESQIKVPALTAACDAADKVIATSTARANWVADAKAAVDAIRSVMPGTASAHQTAAAQFINAQIGRIRGE